MQERTYSKSPTECWRSSTITFLLRKRSAMLTLSKPKAHSYHDVSDEVAGYIFSTIGDTLMELTLSVSAYMGSTLRPRRGIWEPRDTHHPTYWLHTVRNM